MCVLDSQIHFYDHVKFINIYCSICLPLPLSLPLPRSPPASRLAPPQRQRQCHSHVASVAAACGVSLIVFICTQPFAMAVSVFVSVSRVVSVYICLFATLLYLRLSIATHRDTQTQTVNPPARRPKATPRALHLQPDTDAA